MYGFEAGRTTTSASTARDLTLPEAALLAALPKGPVAYSPMLNPERAFRRRNHGDQRDAGRRHDHAAQANEAKAAPLGLHLEPPPNSVAPWFVEEVRRELERQFGTEMVHEAGLKVYTTLDLRLQQAANRAVLDGLAAYERRHGWRGHLLNVLPAGESMDELPASGLDAADPAGSVFSRDGDRGLAGQRDGEDRRRSALRDSSRTTGRGPARRIRQSCSSWATSSMSRSRARRPMPVLAGRWSRTPARRRR